MPRSIASLPSSRRSRLRLPTARIPTARRARRARAAGGAPIRGQTAKTHPPDAQADSGAGGAGANPDAGDQDERNRPPNRRRRTGGAGGTGKGPQGYRGDTPDDRLDAALEHIREAAESRRLPEELPPDQPAAEGKDW